MQLSGSLTVINLAVLFFLAALGVLAWAGPGTAHGPSGQASAPYEAYEAGNFPAAYKGLENPLPAGDGEILAGQRFYEQNCIMCHGASAEGDGHMAAMMETKPADLRQMLRHFPDVDDYYFWIISEGGGRFDLPMPGFGENLSDTQIWQLVTWMQSGFPGAGTEIEDRMHHKDHGSHDPAHQPGEHMMQN